MTASHLSSHLSPQSGLRNESLLRKRRFWLRAVWFSIAGVILPPVLGLIGTVAGMMGAFEGVSRDGGADQEMLAGGVSVAVWATACGFVVTTIAFLVFVAVLTRLVMLPKPVANDPPAGAQAE
jgi:biopolymer transport protein ExbB/TolQ